MASCPHGALRAAWLQGMKGQGKGLPLAHQTISDLISSCFSGATSEAQSDVKFPGSHRQAGKPGPWNFKASFISPAASHALQGEDF